MDNVFVGHSVTSIMIHICAPRPENVGPTEAGLESRDHGGQEGRLFGSGAMISSKVTIGGNAIVGAGSVITKDVPAAIVAIPQEFSASGLSRNASV